MIDYDEENFQDTLCAEEYFSDGPDTNPVHLVQSTKRAKRKKRKVWFLVHSKLSPSVYKVFIDVATGQLDIGKGETNLKKIIRSLMNTGELGVVKNLNHAVLGPLDYAIVHLLTHRLVLHSEQRSRILDYCTRAFIDTSDPIGASIDYIETNYFGFGNEIRVRDQLLKRIKLQPIEENAAEGSQYFEAPVNYVGKFFEETEFNDPQQPGPSNEQIAKIPFRFKEPVYHPDKDLTKSAILDEHHDILYELLTGTMGIDEVVDEKLHEYLFPELWKWLIPEEIDEMRDDELVFGFRIRRRSDSRIILKTSETELIWNLAKEKLHSTHTNDQISFYVLEKYVGAAQTCDFCDPFSTVLLRGTQIVFPSPPPTIGSTAMQYVQIDVIEMPECKFNGREYTNILVIVDLYSNFLFVKALFGVVEPDQLVRHLVDVFGTFSVPEGFRSGSPHRALSVAINDIRNMFDVGINYLGLGTIIPFMVRNEICKKAKQIGRANSWVEVLPSTVIALNQTPHKAFDVKFSAFEVIFKRRPWKNQNIPPWITSGQNENASKIEIIEQDYFERSLNTFLNKQKPILNEYQEVVDPGTGFLFQPNDYVYIKNPCYQESTELVAKEIPITNPRYFRAVITEVDLSNVNFIYRVRYWDNGNLDELPANSWPEPGARETRVHAYDIVASTPRLAYLRNTIYTKFNTLSEAPLSANPICLYQPKKTVKKKPTNIIQSLQFTGRLHEGNSRIQPLNKKTAILRIKPTDHLFDSKISKKKKTKKKIIAKKEKTFEEEEQMKKIEEILKSTFKWKPISGDKSLPSTSKTLASNGHHQLLRPSYLSSNTPKVNSTWLVPREEKALEPSVKDYVRSLVRKSLLGAYRSSRISPYIKSTTPIQKNIATTSAGIRIVMPRILSSQSTSKRNS